MDPFFYLPLAGLAFFIISGVYFYIGKDKIIKKYMQPDAVKLNKVNGTIVTVTKGGLSYRKRLQWCSFEIFMNQNSMFLFPKDFYIIPRNCVNLRFGSDRRNTKNPEVLREFHIYDNYVELILYPDHMLNTKRTISLTGLNQEEVLLFRKALIKEA
ncbi:hypothetical protein [Chryseobacterium oncorhynchi]|uniref:Uncharacterized protein n=1 Tax=Chryseobacterium oncorhynchi TaxID=741074 RepID=A0A316WZB9_9FLAO|nr:hypothetical protein [Chryseobacterium oncorhynchi]PWN66695.1 hypothetical protein C1638_010195 [Chryseobacterium oncorhynchi]